MRQREQRAKFAAALVQAQSQSAALEQLDNLDGVLPLARVHQAIGRQVWQVAGALDVSLREMTLNDLGNPTARQLLADSVIGPLRDLHGGPFEQLRSQLERLRGRHDRPERARCSPASPARDCPFDAANPRGNVAMGKLCRCGQSIAPYRQVASGAEVQYGTRRRRNKPINCSTNRHPLFLNWFCALQFDSHRRPT